jgi:hypothetical protein
MLVWHKMQLISFSISLKILKEIDVLVRQIDYVAMLVRRDLISPDTTHGVTVEDLRLAFEAVNTKAVP